MAAPADLTDGPNDVRCGYRRGGAVHPQLSHLPRVELRWQFRQAVHEFGSRPETPRA